MAHTNRQRRRGSVCALIMYWFVRRNLQMVLQRMLLATVIVTIIVTRMLLRFGATVMLVIVVAIRFVVAFAAILL